MRKLIFIFALMCGVMFTSCEKVVSKQVDTVDTVAVDTVAVDILTVDTFAVDSLQ